MPAVSLLEGITHDSPGAADELAGGSADPRKPSCWVLWLSTPRPENMEIFKARIAGKPPPAIDIRESSIIEGHRGSSRVIEVPTSVSSLLIWRFLLPLFPMDEACIVAQI